MNSPVKRESDEIQNWWVTTRLNHSLCKIDDVKGVKMKFVVSVAQYSEAKLDGTYNPVSCIFRIEKLKRLKNHALVFLSRYSRHFPPF